MRSYELDSVDLMEITEEVESFEPLIAFAKKIGASAQWQSSPSKIDGLKQSQSTRQAPPEIFQCSYGL